MGTYQIEAPVLRFFWAACWRTAGPMPDRRLLGGGEYGLPMLFNTKRQAKEWIDANYGYIAAQPELRKAPKYLRMPVPVLVSLKVVPMHEV